MSVLHNGAGSAFRLPGSSSVRKKSVRFAGGAANDENAPTGLTLKPGLVRAKSFGPAASSRPKTPGRKALGNISNSVNTPLRKHLGFAGSAKKMGFSARKKSAKKKSRPALGDISNVSLLGSGAGSLGKLKKVKKKTKEAKKRTKKFKKIKKLESTTKIEQKLKGASQFEPSKKVTTTAEGTVVVASTALGDEDGDVPEPELAAGGGSARTADIEYKGDFSIEPVAELLKITGGLGGPTVETTMGAKLWDFAGPEDLGPSDDALRKDDVPDLL